MIKATNSIKGKINTPQNLKGKTNASIIREYPELENIEITPTVEDQTYTPTKYGFEEVKVKGVQAYIDEDIKPEYIKDGVDILGVIGNVVELQGEEKTIIPSTTQQIIVPSDGKNGMTRITVEAVDSSIDENIKPENIKEGTNILGIDGQYRGIDTSNATATADDVLKGKTSYSQNKEITGTIETYDGSFEGNVGENIKITDARYLFYNGARTDYLNKFLLLCENIKSCERMFYNCNKLTDLDLSNFDVSQVTNMSNMFYSCTQLINLDLSSFNTSNVTDFNNMFYMCDRLINLDLSSFDTSQAKNMNYMFAYCRTLTSLDLSSFDTSNVTAIGYFVYYCDELEDLDLSKFNLIKTNYILNMMHCNKLVNLKWGINLGKAYKQKTNNYNNYKLDLSSSPLLTHESLMSVINNLYDLNLTYGVYDEEGNDLGGTLYRQSLVLGTTNLAKLTDEEIAIATNKGWNVS